eukprot:CAMPEP_0184740414 /NCGR_PEP_ID=MMETSP0315-20130426/3448_1 /TAXON_ID=101924 /ORGANISM="Rhodosorus marinus, Strain UTEX LB 2760" /LENGTH=246 /DNA_ID=CAMNT_0027210095 /DNA_START=41 /DNA_END=781 /DNA_ORIENTATION=+
MICKVCGEANESPKRPLCLLHSEFCDKCERAYLKYALSDRFQFPVRCMDDTCSDFISAKAVEESKLLGEGELCKYKRFQNEVNTNEVRYCPEPRCAAAIRYDFRRSKGTSSCSECGLSICTVCFSVAHEGTCSSQLSVIETALLLREGYRKCGCGALVERVEGCNAVVCICKQKLCYNCGSKIPPRSHSCPFGCLLSENNANEAEETDDVDTPWSTAADKTVGWIQCFFMSITSFAQFADNQHVDN